uniref:Uncharacterized protein LOC114333535 n=1 Tax=Diabrotica virgifera virgifera TaxID=50390 RepID=A0A6P7G3T1_DIAVI
MLIFCLYTSVTRFLNYYFIDAVQSSVKIPKSVAEVIKCVHQTKWNLIKTRQEVNKGYKEICIPLLEKCRFLLYEVKPAISLEMEAFKKVNVLYKEPRVRTLVKKVIKDLKCGRHTSEIQKPEDIVNATIQSQSIERHKSSEDISKMRKASSDGKISESKSETDDVNNEIKNSTQKAAVVTETFNTNASKPTKNCGDMKNDLEEKWAVEKTENITRVEPTPQDKEKKLETQLMLTGIVTKLHEKQMKKVSNENLDMIHSILQFVTNSSCDIEILRKVMYNQVSF